jgi:hypothetical protein
LDLDPKQQARVALSVAKKSMEPFSIIISHNPLDPCRQHPIFDFILRAVTVENRTDDRPDDHAELGLHLPDRSR